MVQPDLWGFRRSRWIRTDVAGIAVRQIQREEVGLLIDAAGYDDRFANVGLGMTRPVRQRDEHFTMPPPILSHLILYDGTSPLKAMLVTEPFENPIGCLPLLVRSFPILR